MNKQPEQITLNEIYKQSESFESLYNSLPDIYSVLKKVFSEKYDEVIFTGCGTSLYLAQTSAYIFNLYNKATATAVCCSELYNTPNVYIKGKKTLILPITRKSYTTEVRMAIEKVRKLAGVTTLAITCDKDSEQYNDYYVLAPNTDEKSVVMTTSFTSMLFLSTIVSLYCANRISEIENLKDVPKLTKELLPKMDKLADKIINENPNLDLFITLGQGAFYGVANECMNKMKEMGLSNSEAYYSLEYRHGPMSLVTENTLVIMLTDVSTAESEKSLMKQLEGFGAVSVVVGAQPELIPAKYSIKSGYDYLSSVITDAIISQYLGYYVSQKKGLNVDSPRHLSQAIVL